MKIIKPPPPWTIKFTCKGCHAELEAEASDVRIGTFGACHYAGDSGESKLYVTCPACRTAKVLAESRVPVDVQNKAKRDKD